MVYLVANVISGIMALYKQKQCTNMTIQQDTRSVCDAVVAGRRLSGINVEPHAGFLNSI